MKLNSFLQENIQSTKSWSIISKFEEEQVDMVKKIVDALKSYRFTEEFVENPEDSHDGRGKIRIAFSDGLVEIGLTISTTEKDGAIEFSFLMVSAKVLPKYLVNVKDNRPDITYFSAFRVNDAISELQEKIETFKKAVDDFVEWYFDMSGTYGKVKLFKTHYNIIEGYHDSNQPRFVAVVGDFMCTDEVGGTKTFKVEPRIL